MIASYEIMYDLVITRRTSLLYYKIKETKRVHKKGEKGRFVLFVRRVCQNSSEEIAQKKKGE